MRKKLAILVLALCAVGLCAQPPFYPVVDVWTATNQTLFPNTSLTNGQQVVFNLAPGGLPVNTIMPGNVITNAPVTNLNLLGQKAVSVFVEVVSTVFTNIGTNGVAFMTNGMLTNLVGYGIAGYGGDGGYGSNAMLNWPVAICFDLNSNLYISDFANNRVRKWNTLTGIITTFAGNGSNGYSGDGAQATNAALNGPWGLVCDTASNIYIADSGNSRVRVVGTNGVIYTYVGTNTAGFSGDGGSCSNAQLNFPTGLGMDGASNSLYICDTGNSRVRRVLSNDVISTVAGTNAIGYAGDGASPLNASLNGPMAVVVTSGNPNFFIADTSNSVVRQVTNNVIWTFTGTNVAGFSGDGSGCSNAALNLPMGLLLSSKTNVFIADYKNGRVREVTNGIIQTVIGGGTGGNGTATSAQLPFPMGLASYQFTNVFVTWNGTNAVPAIGSGNLVLPFQVSPDYDFWSALGQTNNALWIQDTNNVLTIAMSSNSSGSTTTWTNSGWTNLNATGWQRIRLGYPGNTHSNLLASNLWIELFYK